MRFCSRLSWVLALSLLAGCELAQLPPDTVFRCEADGSCAQPGYVCGGDRVCRPPTDAGATDAGRDAGVDAGTDAGLDDAGTDAGLDDAGTDAGLDDAGTDAGMDDAGTDAGLEDAGTDAGLDAGPDDAGVDAGFDAGVDAGIDAGCVPTGAVDEPDPSQLDVDCDGFDGDLSRAVFVDPVNGSNANTGTRASPVQTLAHASSLAKEQVYLATGTFPGSVTFTHAVALYGGYDSANAWARTTTKSVVTGSLVASPTDAGRVVLELLDVQAPAGATPGAPSVAVSLINASAASRITSCRLVGGTGANGSDGVGAPSVNPGNAGGAGLTGDGGLGGAAADCGDAGTSSAGFAGGSSLDTGVGTNGDDPTLGGLGAPETVCDGGVFVGLDGGDALAGAAGAPSSSRPADPPAGTLGTVTASGWQGVSLGTWAPAQHGTPGGGGGAGGGLVDLINALLARGGGAGGGGSGGCGGRSGTAGQAGGASIGLVLFNSSPTLSNVLLVSTQGGRGGNGGPAGAGGAGGPGGAGALGETVAAGSAGVGGRGGAGGAGGPGRQGPGGWGGPLAGLFCGGTSAPVTDATTTWMGGVAGLAGTGDPNGQPGGQPSSGYKVNCP